MSDPLPVQPEMNAADKIVNRFLDEIGEHVDSAQVFVTRKRDDGNQGTSHMAKGTGNWFSRYGQIKIWVLREEERQSAEIWRESEET